MTATELIAALQGHVSRQRQRMEAMASMLEGHRYSEVQQMLFTSISDCELTERQLVQIGDSVRQLDLFA